MITYRTAILSDAKKLADTLLSFEYCIFALSNYKNIIL